MAHLLPQAAAAFQVGADVIELPSEAALQQVAAEAAAEAGLDVPSFDDQHEWRGRQRLHHGPVGDVQSRLINEPDIYAAFLQRDDGVKCPINGFAGRDDIAAPGFRLPYHVILAGLEQLAL